jgi:hypothetical protein
MMRRDQGSNQIGVGDGDNDFVIRVNGQTVSMSRGNSTGVFPSYPAEGNPGKPGFSETHFESAIKDHFSAHGHQMS